MASLLEKVRTLLSATGHSLVDAALKANSVAVMDEYIRQAENNLEALEDATATVGGGVKTLKRKYDEFAEQSTKLDRDIDALLQQGREDLATAAQSKLNSTEHLRDQYKEQYDRQQVEYQNLMGAKLKLEAKLTETKQSREEMLALLDLAKSKELTVKTIKSLDDMAGLGDADVSRMTDSIRARLDKASAKSEMLASRLDDQMDEVLGKTELDGQLADRKKRLGLDQPTAQPAG